MISRGCRFTSKSDGDVEVLSYTSAKSVRIVFIETGNEYTVRAEHIRSGLIRDKDKVRTYFGVGCGTPVKSRAFSVWYGILSRCYNESDTQYEYYGGRGVGVCVKNG